MPPKKKARKQKSTSSNGTTEEELGKLVKWLSREQLEAFVINAVTDGAIDDSELWNSVPERAVIEIRKPSAPVSKGNDRVGTGSFNLVDQSLMREIFSYCGLLDKIACVTCVCKAWRGYKTIPGLFTDLSEKLVKSSKVSTYNHAKFLMDLLDFVPDESAIEAVRLATARSDDHNFCGKIFVRLGKIKTDAKKAGRPFHLKKLVLQGEKLSLTVLKKLVASGMCSSLTSLVFDDVYGSRKKLPKDNAVPTLLAACPSLEELVIPANVLQERSLAAHVAALSEARGGAPSVLKVIDLTSDGFDYDGRKAVSWQIISKLGAHAPFLEVLKVMEISSDTPFQSDPSSDRFVEATPPLSDFLAEPFVALPNLRVFKLGRIIPSWEFQYELAPRYVPTPYMTRIISRLMEAAPALESFTFGHGKHGRVSQKKLKSGRLVVPPLPTFEATMVNLPRSLTSLALNQVLVDPSEFRGLEVRGFDKIQFRDCGAAMDETIQMLHQEAPQFELTTNAISNEAKEVRICRLGY